MALAELIKPLGRQINFFMSREDEKTFLEHVKHGARVEIFANSSSMEHPLSISNMPDEVGHGLDERRFFLYNRDVSSKLFSVASKNKTSYSIDWTRSSVIEFQRCIIENRVIYSGRIWADFLAYDVATETAQEKETEFKRWYENLAEGIRKRYRPIRLYDPGRSKVPSSIIYIGPGAEEIHRGGTQLSPNPPGVKGLVLVDLEGKTTWVERDLPTI